MNVVVARYGYELFPGKRWMEVVGCECFSIRAWLIVGDCDYLTGEYGLVHGFKVPKNM